MGRTRQQQSPSTNQRSDTAAAIAAALMAGGATQAGLAALLLPLLPTAFVFATPDLAAQVAQEAAALTLTNPPIFRREVGEFERRAGLENLLLRGFYAIAAVQRLSAALLAPSGTSTKETLAKALRVEGSYLTAHINAAERRVEGAMRTEDARKLFGDIVTWSHGVHGTPMEPRPSHVAANGKQWDLRRGVPLSTGALPRTLPNCTCDWGPAKAGAERLL